MNASPHSTAVKIIYNANKLKDKVMGRGSKDNAYFPLKSILDAEKEQFSLDPEIINSEMESLVSNASSLWKTLKTNEQGRAHIQTMLSIYVNRIIDLSLTFSYDLMVHFAKSFKIFLEEIDLKNPVHVIIAQAHIDVINLAHKNKIRTQDNPLAQDLMKTLQKAVEQNTEQTD